MAIRKIYVEEGELVEIRSVPKGAEKCASEFNLHLYPEHHKYLARIYGRAIDIAVVMPFDFYMDGKIYKTGSPTPTQPLTPSIETETEQNGH